ncbi:type 4a pilus biogenesis protein PilO [Pseudomonas benzenivorans]|uniref:Type 4a pilus biogenesis protein PilO n=1 Tax=Pseudomonas benzenivorans TaxID=556533 RepID=A0ABY5H4B0_9PSED|nr:type 4a pilus biogenesis protein PilO [Pseudomonas benzenivorans]UTW07137.1 type 4a pilus biogenesis protein PilO [Pseudomonas benzenivorans]
MSWDQWLKTLDSRSLVLAVGGAALLLTVALVSLLLVPQVKSYLAVGDSLALIEQTPGSGEQLDQELESLRQVVAQLERRLHGDMAQLPAKQLQNYVVDALQTLSWRHQVALSSVVPRQGTTIDRYQELVFEVELKGNYFDFYAWLQQLREALGFVVISHFDIQPLSTEPGQTPLSIKLSLTTYREIK